MNEDAAGLDVGATFHFVAVPPERDAEPVRTFQSFTADLHALAEWLQSVGIRTIAMESTGVYWIPVYEVLEQRGFEVLLVNARDTRNVPGLLYDSLTSQKMATAPTLQPFWSSRGNAVPSISRLIPSRQWSTKLAFDGFW